jgi:hypothetical protein
MSDPVIKHFCTHALTDLIDSQNRTGGRTRAGDVLPWDVFRMGLIGWLRQAQKFAVTEDELMHVPEDIIKEWITGEHMRLPFEFTAIELDLINGDNMKDGLTNANVEFTGCVLLCADLQKIEKHIFDAIQEDIDFADDTGGFLVWPIVHTRASGFQVHDTESWVATPTLAVMLPADEMVEWVARANSDQKFQTHGNEGDPFLMVQHLIDGQMVMDEIVTAFEDTAGQSWREQPKAEWDKQLSLLMQGLGEVLLRNVKYVSALAVLLNTKNIKYRLHPAPGKLNHKRRKKGREPFFEYKTLNLYPDDVTYVGPSLGPHRYRRSPKLHLRRGHVRRLGDGGTTFVRQAIIGKKKHGLVLKDYDVKQKGETK